MYRSHFDEEEALRFAGNSESLILFYAAKAICKGLADVANAIRPDDQAERAAGWDRYWKDHGPAS